MQVSAAPYPGSDLKAASSAARDCAPWGWLRPSAPLTSIFALHNPRRVLCHSSRFADGEAASERGGALLGSPSSQGQGGDLSLGSPQGHSTPQPGEGWCLRPSCFRIFWVMTPPFPYHLIHYSFKAHGAVCVGLRRSLDADSTSLTPFPPPTPCAAPGPGLLPAGGWAALSQEAPDWHLESQVPAPGLQLPCCVGHSGLSCPGLAASFVKRRRQPLL